MSEIEALNRVRRLARLGQARAIREEAHVSLREMSNVIGTSPASLSRWERGKVSPRAAVALRWAQVLGELSGR